MYLVLSTYVAPAEEVAAVRDVEPPMVRRPLRGRSCRPRGAAGATSVILVDSSSRDDVDAMLADEPYKMAGVATYEVVELAVSPTSANVALFTRTVLLSGTLRVPPAPFRAASLRPSAPLSREATPRAARARRPVSAG